MQNLQYIGKIMKPITRYLEHYYTNRQLNKKLSYWIQHIQLFFFDYHGKKRENRDARKLRSINIIGCKILSSLNVNLMEILTL